MRSFFPLLFLGFLSASGCKQAVQEPQPPPQTAQPEAAQPAPSAAADYGACKPEQAALARKADERAGPRGTAHHRAEHFRDNRAAWLMKEADYQKYIEGPKARTFGPCGQGACYQFAAPVDRIEAAVSKAMHGNQIDAEALGKALGLPPSSFEGGKLRLITVEISQGVCARLPLDDDPGARKCKAGSDEPCFKFGGFTSGGIPEIMLIDVPVAAATIRTVP